MVELVALYMAGLSFFFTGIAGIADNLRQITGPRFRVLLSGATNHPVRAGMLGAIAGAVTQSTSVVMFILSGMIASGLLPLRRALVVLACANIGTAALVFVAAVDLQLPILLLIGVSGLFLAFKVFKKWRPGIGALLSIGLVFFGLDMMKHAFQPLSETKSLLRVARFFNHYPDLAFLLGALMRSVVHSSSACAAITITINRGNLLGEFGAMMSLAGLGLGTATAAWFLSSNLRGIPRQIAIYQGVTNMAAGVFLASLLLVERLSGVPLLLALANAISKSNSHRMAVMYLILNLVIASIAIGGLRWAPGWLARLSPPTLEESLSRPIYLQAEALRSPETAPDLVALEQLRLMFALTEYLEAARGAAGHKLKALHSSALSLAQEITDFLQLLIREPIAASLAARVISFQRKQEILRALEENVFLFAETLEHQGSEELCARLVEALDTILLTASDAAKSREKLDIDLLVSLTDDRGGMMERLRSRYRPDDSESATNVAKLHYATTLFERNVWLLRQMALWMREDLKLNET
jgi:phosphate:Na+ symporter